MQRRCGFTFVELMIVVVIIGILAAIGYMKVAAPKERALLTRMGSDLRNLMHSQESYYNVYQTYYGGAVPHAELVYNPSEDVTVTIAEAVPGGWSATSTHPMTPKHCAIFVGSATPVAPATVHARVACGN